MPLFLDEYLKVKRLYDLKQISRTTHVGTRQESSAEHSWSTLILADTLMSAHDLDVDRLKVYELIMYHDVVEIEAGDVAEMDKKGRQGKKEREEKALYSLADQIPVHMKEKFIALFQEYEQSQTREARFAKAVDKLDAKLHELDYRESWKLYSEEFMRDGMGKYMKEFPELDELFESFLVYLREQKYI